MERGVCWFQGHLVSFLCVECI